MDFVAAFDTLILSVIVIFEETSWGLDELTVKVDLFVNVDSVGVVLSDHGVVE